MLDVSDEEVERIAYDRLGLLPRDVEILTPAELLRLAAGWRWRDERRREELAWAVYWIVNTSGMLKRPISYETLLAELLGGERVAERVLTRRDAEREAAG